MSFSLNATIVNSEESTFYGNNGKSYIFVVQNVEFSVFPDGQFDFTYIGDYNNTNVTLSSPNASISFNSGYNYDMFVQYDEYGAVVQVEDVSVYYDEYGRIAQAGEVEIRYSNRRIVRVGGLYVHYNYYGYYSHSTGYINPFNYYYVYRPWHTFYVKPLYASCIVYDYPYRRYYSPVRYSYYDHHNYYTKRGRNNVAYSNGRRSFNKPGSRVHYKGGRSVANKDYKSNRRNTAVSQTSRRSNSDSRTSNNNTIRKTSKKVERGAVKNTNSITRRVSSNYNNSGNRDTSTSTRKVSYKRNVNQNKSERKYTSSNKSASTVNRNKKASNNNIRSNSSKSSSTKRVASNSQRKSPSKSNSNSRGTSSKRGRGL